MKIVISDKRQLLFAERATEIIIAACRMAKRPTVLLPALYCYEVASAINDAGLNYRCYDLAPDLSFSSSSIDMALGHDIGSIVLLHPFGFYRPFPSVDMSGKIIVVEDACHSLRTSHYCLGIGSVGNLVVYSPRKELGWPTGGIAIGPLGVTLRSVLAPAHQVKSRWQTTDINLLAEEGLKATEFAASVLGDRLPPLKKGEVLTALPLKSSKRDTVIKKLRRSDIQAWRWIRPLKNTGPNQTPGAWALRQKLLLVPMCAGAELERTVDMLGRELLESWGY
jgi:hypothetical protein